MKVKLRTPKDSTLEEIKVVVWTAWQKSKGEENRDKG